MAFCGGERTTHAIDLIDRARFWHVVFALGILIGLVVRWSFPSADPPLHRQTGAILYDEVWGFAARNAVLWGAWQQDEWRPWVVCPIHTLLLEGSFRLFGITPFGLRFPAMLSGTLILGYTFVQLRVARFSTMGGLVGAFVLATSWSMTGFSKCMTLEPSLLHFFALAMLILVAAEGCSRGGAALYAIAGACAGLAILCKTSGVPMALSIAPYLLLGTVARAGVAPWHWRITRTLAYLAGVIAVVSAGFWLWMLPDFESFYKLTIQTSFLERAQNPLIMRAYKAVFWLESQAFLTTPFWLCALLLLIPTFLRASQPGTTQAAKMRRFAIGMASTSILVGLALMINVDVPARRLVYLSIPLAILTGALWDKISIPATRRSVLMFDEGHATSRQTLRRRVGARAACMIAGLLVAGWIVSPNGGITSFLTPRFAAWLLFDIHAKIAYKLLWLCAGLGIGTVLWRVRDRIWAERRTVMAFALLAHGAFYLVASGLWVSRLTHTGLAASRTLQEMVPPGAYILGADAAAQGFFNESRPLFWSPKVYRFANYDEDAIQRTFDPEYMLLNAVDLARLRDGTYPSSPYISSFLNNELARLPLYEYHESLSLGTELVLLRRKAR